MSDAGLNQGKPAEVSEDMIRSAAVGQYVGQSSIPGSWNLRIVIDLYDSFYSHPSASGDGFAVPSLSLETVVVRRYCIVSPLPHGSGRACYHRRRPAFDRRQEVGDAEARGRRLRTLPRPAAA